MLLLGHQIFKPMSSVPWVVACWKQAIQHVALCWSDVSNISTSCALLNRIEPGSIPFNNVQHCSCGSVRRTQISFFPSTPVSLTEKIHYQHAMCWKANENIWKFIMEPTSLDIPQHFCCWEISDSLYSDNACVTDWKYTCIKVQRVERP